MSTPRPPRVPRVVSQTASTASPDSQLETSSQSSAGEQGQPKQSVDKAETAEKAGKRAKAGKTGWVDSLGRAAKRGTKPGTKRETSQESKREVKRGKDKDKVAAAEPRGQFSHSRQLKVPKAARPQGVEILSSKDERITDLGERRKERCKERRRAQWAAIFYRTLATVAVGGVLAGIVWALWFSPLFALNAQRVKVTGETDEFDSTTLMQVIADQEGTPLLRLDLEAIEAAALTDPNVLEAVANRAWPNGVTVEITLRIPAFAIAEGGSYQYVATDGVAVSSGNADAGDLLVLSVTEKAGTDGYAQAIELATEVYANLGESLLEQIESMEVSVRSVNLLLTSGATVVWGGATDSNLKGEVLELLISQRSASKYDVSDPARPVTTN